MDQGEQVDGGVEERRLEVSFKINVIGNGFADLDVSGDVDEGEDMDYELAEDGADDVWVEDVILRPFLGELLNRLEN